ncbi:MULTISPECIES: tRNA (N6-threonylcarbamoyladenosine(37)-N6)-methyltransferase TrmO [Aerococcus]|nr:MULTISPECIES: tRNA (N6-threonylcarbamoyladenosine(37)-N6)-methyltransferase TrmO [Aerococcus]KAA9234392.1 tRNA (N6-threonylcarbamoyladenosine(37)-N6)-methyltransferase TrmO [Aerococcus mictus]MBU5610331.1 tRNA (N6-threonylcarbamoyladenosine(37)-N6)-methyltransferase TrmO [Aerococcus urinae]MDK6291480.1 tRNA (N6-threonylcarbamoyladenosine(37)-N6)-methyltransferase TrmO [Aerococcus urinae]MDK6374519.1 tRNA (N6-threonylcarbamoyladenosine(37)-N6)-methyltransferase TrmO [Aerococcus urinae]MDK642
MEIHPIAHIHTPFKEKFGIPRQGVKAEHSYGEIIFEKEYRQLEAFKGIEDFTYLWLIWGFSQVKESANFKATVRPPRLGGNQRVGVFASRSPFRPNRLALSAVKLEALESDSPEGPKLIVSGIDMVDGTPIYDIKPYSSESDALNDGQSGFIDQVAFNTLQVHWPEDLADQVSQAERAGITEVLAADPRPAYQRQEDREYGMLYGGYNIRFQVRDQICYLLSLDPIRN